MVHEFGCVVTGFFQLVVDQGTFFQNVPGVALCIFDFHADRQGFAFLPECRVFIGDQVSPPVGGVEVHAQELFQPAPVICLNRIIDIPGLEVSGKIVSGRRNGFDSG